MYVSEIQNMIRKALFICPERQASKKSKRLYVYEI